VNRGSPSKLLFVPWIGWYEQPEVACRKQHIPTVGGDRESLRALPAQLVRIPENVKYFLTAMDYVPVDPGGYITVFLRGLKLPSETTVLVNNVALTKRGRLPRPDLPLGTANPSTDVNGDYEVVSGDTIVMRFTCGPSFSGVSEITLVTPSRSLEVNRLPLLINRVFSRLENYTDPLLSATVLPFFRPNPAVTRVDYLDVNSNANQQSGHRPPDDSRIAS
jgi:hypothetical protein